MVRLGNIVADEDGLSWGFKFNRKFARWDEVTHFFDQPCSANYEGFACAVWQGVVRTLTGTLTFGEWDRRNGRRFRAYVSRHATSAFAGWGPDRQEPTDWPPVYRCNTIITENALRRMRHWPWLGVVFALAYFAWQWVTARAVPGWGWLLTPAGLFFLGKLAVSMIAHWIYYREGPFRDTSVRAHVKGLTFTGGGAREEEEVAWADITDFYYRGRRYVVVTARGEYGFHSALDPHASLQTIIRRYAVNAQATDWRGRGRSKTALGRNGPWYSRADR